MTAQQRTEEIKFIPGTEIEVDSWDMSTTIALVDEVDRSFFGGDVVRINTRQKFTPTIPARVTVTGRKILYRHGLYCKRCSIAFLDDNGAPVVTAVSGGYIYFPWNR